MAAKGERLFISEEDYHADKLPAFAGDKPRLSNSIAKVLLDRSPAHAATSHPKMGGVRVESDRFDAGKLWHKLVLGKGAEIVPIDASDWRTQAARQARDETRAAGKIPALMADYERAVAGSAAVVKKLSDRGILLSGESEVGLAWCEERDVPVWCRGLLDHLIIEGDRATIYDLKTGSAHPQSISHSVVRWSYDTQRAAYSRAVEAVFGIRPSKIDFVFLFAEMAEPFAVTAGRLDPVLTARGEERWCQAVDLWAECIRLDRWPEYTNGIIEIAAPPWMSGDIQIGFEEE